MMQRTTDTFRTSPKSPKCVSPPEKPLVKENMLVQVKQQQLLPAVDWGEAGDEYKHKKKTLVSSQVREWKDN